MNSVKVLVCPGELSEASGTPMCSAGWQSASLPVPTDPPSIADTVLMCGLVLGVWVVAFVFKVLRRTL